MSINSRRSKKIEPYEDPIFLASNICSWNPFDLYFGGFNPPKQAPFQAKEGLFGLKVYRSIYCGMYVYIYINIYLFIERERFIYLSIERASFFFRCATECVSALEIKKTSRRKWANQMLGYSGRKDE